MLATSLIYELSNYQLFGKRGLTYREIQFYKNEARLLYSTVQQKWPFKNPIRERYNEKIEYTLNRYLKNYWKPTSTNHSLWVNPRLKRMNSYGQPTYKWSKFQPRTCIRTGVFGKLEILECTLKWLWSDNCSNQVRHVMRCRQRADSTAPYMFTYEVAYCGWYQYFPNNVTNSTDKSVPKRRTINVIWCSYVFPFIFYPPVW